MKRAIFWDTKNYELRVDETD